MADELHAKVLADRLGSGAAALGCWWEAAGIGCPLPSEVQSIPVADGSMV